VGYGLRVNTALLHSSLVLIPLAVTLVLALFIFTKKGPHAPTFDMSEKWTHEPILWAAEEPADHGHGGHGAHLTVGGGASGKW
jgi:hypothetical protein